MTNASDNTTNGSLELSTNLVFLTGTELRQIEADPDLTARDVLAYRIGGAGE